MAKLTDLVASGARRDLPGSAPPSRVSAPEEPKKRFDPIQFLRETRVEVRKVTWTSWKETWITSVMVGIMVILTAFFFFGVDAVLHAIVTFLLNLANAE